MRNQLSHQENKSWFVERQKQLLRFFNTEAGFHILKKEGLIKRGEENHIVYMGPSALVLRESNHVYKAYLTSSQKLNTIVMPIIEEMELAIPQNFNRIMENPYQAFLHFADLGYVKGLPRYLFDSANITANSDSTGILYYSAASYAGARNGSQGTLEVNASRIMSRFGGGVYDVCRQFDFFDATTAVPTGSTATAVTFRLRRYTNRNDADSSSVYVAAHTATAPVNSNTDFNANGATKFGQATQASMSSSAETDIVLNASGISAFVPGAINNYGLRNSLDFDNSTPSGQNNIDSDATAQVLVVTYTPPATTGASFLLNFI